MFDLFGEGMPLPAKFFIAFAVVLALIGLTAWLVRRFGGNRLGGANARGRQPRLAVIDASPVDGRRRLVLIRRDNVEHLLMIGGPTDVVVEQNIVRGAAAIRETTTRETTSREPSLRATSSAATENAWPLQPAGEPTPVAAPRPYRAAATEEPWLPPEPGARARPADSNSLAGLAVELSTRLTPPEPAPVARSEPPARPAPPPIATPEPVAVMPPQDDHNLAEMAQQLEAALRRAPMPEPHRPPVTDPLAAQPARSAEPAPAPRAPARDYKLRIDPKFETRPESKFEARPEPKYEPRIETKFDTKAEPRFDMPPEPNLDTRPEAPPAGQKNVFDNLEEEMASLLGRPPGKP
jgi:flagellar protein FliO/FliZ